MTPQPGLRALVSVMLPALAAAALTVAGAGVAVAGFAAQSQYNVIGEDTFIAVALTVAVLDVVVVPAWLWRRGRPGIGPLSARLAIAFGALPGAVIAGFLVLWAGSLVWPQLIGGSKPVGTFLLFGTMFAVAGAVVGVGAALAQVADAETRSGRAPAGRVRSHVMGGVLGLGVVFAIKAAANAAGWPGWVLLAPPLMLVLGGLPHNASVLRDTIRLGRAMPDRAPMLQRAATVALGLTLIGMTLAVTAL